MRPNFVYKCDIMQHNFQAKHMKLSCEAISYTYIFYLFKNATQFLPVTWILTKRHTIPLHTKYAHFCTDKTYTWILITSVYKLHIIYLHITCLLQTWNNQYVKISQWNEWLGEGGLFILWAAGRVPMNEYSVHPLMPKRYFCTSM